MFPNSVFQWRQKLSVLLTSKNVEFFRKSPVSKKFDRFLVPFCSIRPRSVHDDFDSKNVTLKQIMLIHWFSFFRLCTIPWRYKNTKEIQYQYSSQQLSQRVLIWKENKEIKYLEYIQE